MKKLLFLFAGCLLFAGANAQEESLYNEWFTDGGASQPLETEQIGAYNAAKIVIPTSASEGDPWSIMFCNIFHDNYRQTEGNNFSITFDAMFVGDDDDVDYATFLFLTGRNRCEWVGEEYNCIHEDYQWTSDNTELSYVEVNGYYYNNYYFNASFNVSNNDWTPITIEGAIGYAGEDYIGIQFNLGGNTNNAGTLYIRNMQVNIGGSNGTNLNYFGTIDLADGNFDYVSLSESTLAVTKFNDTEATSVTVPSTVTIGGTEYTVVAIGNEAFKNCENLTSITIPNTVTSIGDNAFAFCSSLTSINIPASVTTIGEDPFEKCYGLTTITVDAANTDWSADNGVLFDKNKTLLKCFPAGKTGSYTVPNTVTEIANMAFSNCTQIEEVILPDGLQSIGKLAFWDCQNMSSILIPESVTVLKEGAFGNCNNLTINCEAMAAQSGWQNYWYGYESRQINWAYGAWSLSEDGVLTISKNIDASDYSAYPWSSVSDHITSVVFEDGVTTVGYEAFRNCYNLETVTLPSSITTIKYNAFYDCYNLNFNYDENQCAKYLGDEENPYRYLITKTGYTASITVHDDCKVIADYALTYANRVDVPETVEYIGQNAFNQTIAVYYTGSAAGSPWGALAINPVIDGDFLFANEEKTALIKYLGSDSEVTIPSGVVFISEKAFEGNLAITSVEISASVEVIGESAFENCQNLESVTFLGDRVFFIGNNAFKDCHNLASFDLPASVYSIGEYAFYNCSNITSIELPNDSFALLIGQYAFANCSGLESIDLSNINFTNIDRNTFYNCTSLETVVFGNNIKTIGSGAFYNCYNLTNVEIPGSVTSIGNNAFASCSGLELINIPSSVSYLSSDVFYGCHNATILCEANSYDVSYSTYGWNYSQLIWSYKNIEVYAYPNNYEFGEVDGSGYYEYGTEVTITASAYDGYQFVRWSDGSIENPRTITVTGYTEYEAIFVDESETVYTVTLAANDPAYGTVSGGGRYVEDDYVTINAQPAMGYYFVEWSDGNTDQWRYFYAGEDVELTAEFAIYTFDITTTAENGTIDGPADGTYNYGTELTFTAIPAEGYRFMNWTVGYNTVSSNPFTFTVDNDYDITANFVEYPQVFEGENTVYANGREQDNCYFIPEKSATYIIYSNNTSDTYGYLFDVDGNDIVENDDDEDSNFRMVCFLSEGETYRIGAGFYSGSSSGNVTLMIDAAEPATISATAEHGTVEGVGTYDYGTYVCVSAIADEGYTFLRWSGGSTDWQRCFSLTEDIDLGEAIFVTSDLNIYYVSAYNNSSWNAGGVTGSGRYTEAETVTITAEANPGWHFTNWTDGSTENPRIFAATEYVELGANFEREYYTITVLVNNSDYGYVSGGESSYTYGTWVGLSANTSNGECYFTGWDNGETSSYREIYVTSDTTIIANFEINHYDIDGYSANPAQGSVEGSGSYPYGSVATLNAVGATGYHFVMWGDGNTENPRTVNVWYYDSYTAYFEINTYNVIADANLENGSITGTGTYTHGTEATFKAEPASGYKFVRWSNLSTEEEFTTTVTDNMTLSAVFCESSKEIFTVEVKASGRGTVKGASNYYDGEKATFTATPDEGYHFTYWNDDKDATEPTLKKTITKDQTITARFAINTYAVKVVAGENGSVEVKKEGKALTEETVEHGDEITLKATANANYHFAGWSDGNTDAERTISVTKDLNLTANFAKDTYTLSIKAKNGTIKGNGTFEVGESVTITAEPAFGYKFVRWSDGNTDNPRTVTITAELFNTIDNSFTAVFEEAGNATAIEDEVAAEINIYAYGNTIVVENATSDIDVYSAMGQLVSRTTANGERNVITVNGTGIYIVRTGNVAKRVMLQ